MIKNKHIIYIGLGLLFLGLLTGCTEDKETFKSVEFYEKNPSLMKERIKECATIVEFTLIVKKDCNNAIHANKSNNWGNTKGF